MDVTQLVDLAKEKSGAKNDREFAKMLEVSHGSPSQWRLGITLPTPEHVAALAILAQLDPKTIVLDHLEATAKTDELTSVFAELKRRLAAAICILCKIIDRLRATRRPYLSRPLTPASP